MNGYIVYDTSKKTLSSATPRFVYLYFLTVYKLCCFTGLAGYLSILFQFFFCFILSLFQTTRILFEGSVRLLFYAVYYGCLVQDFAELCAEKMSSSIVVMLKFSYFLVTLVKNATPLWHTKSFQ
jgi:hypothetical protein